MFHKCQRVRARLSDGTFVYGYIQEVLLDDDYVVDFPGLRIKLKGRELEAV